MRWIVWVLLVVALTGCGSKDGGSGGFATPDKDGEYFVIHLDDDRTFHPAKAVVPKGALVSFHFGLPNCDVRSEEPGGPDSRSGTYANGIYPVNGHYNWIAPSTAGEYNIYCSRHADMKGVLKIA